MQCHDLTQAYSIFALEQLINMNTNKYSRNLVKLLTNRYYKINFELNHLIKLDNNFLEAEITIRNKYGIKYILN